MTLKPNSGFAQLQEAYIFSQVQKETAEFKKENPEKSLLSLGIGDVTLPLAHPVAEAMKKSAEAMQREEGFHGYAPDGGYPFLREAVASYYRRFGVALDPEYVFIGNGAKSDIAAVGELFEKAPAVLADPVYPVFAESSLLAGREVIYLPAVRENGYLPGPADIPGEKKGKSALIYLCSPNNPTGAVFGYSELSAWISYALSFGCVLLFDACYEAYITENKPHSIYELPGAEYCAVEIGSLSKCAGFTGLRCSWAVFPPSLAVDGISLASLWHRRSAVTFNGVAYPVQRAAEAALSGEGVAAWREQVAYYLENARLLSSALSGCGVSFSGGVNAPYLWLDLKGENSWSFFRRLLSGAGLVGTPGVGFGKAGEGHFRLSAFGSRETALEAARRLTAFFQ